MASAHPVTIFTIPKPFRGHIGVVQRNAIGSWLRLSPPPEIVLFGNEEGVAEIAAEFQLRHEPHLERNEHGTPLLDCAFRRIHEVASHDLLTFINADIVLTDDFLAAIDRVLASGERNFLLIGRRWDVDIREPLNFDQATWRTSVRERALRSGRLAPRVCKDYFVYRRPLFAQIPPFAIGRAVYDNWLVYEAKRQNVPVVDLTPVVLAIHQNHNYAHVVGGSRGQAYVKGEETKLNRRLAGGMRLISGSTCDRILTAHSLQRTRLPSLAQFAADVPRFLRLVYELYTKK